MRRITKAALLLRAFGLTAAAQAQAPVRPNIVVILADDLGYGQLGVTGDRIIRTPNIDRLAAMGVTFTQAYAGGPVCSPSRIALLTGRDPRLLEGNNNGMEIRRQDGTIAQLLGRAGYDTRLVGKWGVGTAFGSNDPMAMGFAHWYGVLDNVSAHRQFPVTLFRDNRLIWVEPNFGGAEAAYAQRLFTDEAVKFIAGPHNQPYFLFLSYTTPHAELAAPERYVAPYRGKYPETPWLGMQAPEPRSSFARFYANPVPQPNATLAGMVAALDDYVGEVVGAIERSGAAANTLVIFTSDNGPHEEGGAQPSVTHAAGPFRGIKRDLYEGGIHVPMIVSWPGRVAGGRADATPVAFYDLAPTFASLAGRTLAAVPNLQSNGTSLAGLLTTPRARLADRTLYWEFKRLPDEPGVGATEDTMQAARRGRWKAVRYGERAGLQLFDVTRDPGEAHDVAARHPAEAGGFRTLFDSAIKRAAGSPLP